MTAYLTAEAASPASALAQPETWVAILTGALAIATFVLAVVTWRNVRVSEGLVAAADISAKAAKDTIAEIQRDRELEYRPYISWRVGVSRAGGFVTGLGLPRIVNYGRGPAIHSVCCLVWRTDGQNKPSIAFALTPLFDLSPNDETHRLGLDTGSGWVPDDPGILGGQIGPNGARVAFCQDQVGNYYRFVPFDVDTEVWRPGLAKPRWVEWYLDRIELSKQQ